MRRILVSVAATLAIFGLVLGVPNTASVSPAVAASSTPNWMKNAVIYEVNVRQYTEAGTFDAFATHLPRLKELGVDVLWFMPIYPISHLNRKGTLGSPYSIADYKAVNPEFGTAQDFKDLVNEAHAQGFHVILDWVANHTGWDHPWITQHKDWYTQDADGNIVWPPGTDWTDVADLNYDNPDMRAAMIDALKYWVTEFEIDGYRADVAGGVPTDFWNIARTELDALGRPLFMLAENSDNIDLLENAFSANYGWPLMSLINNVGKGNMTKTEFEWGVTGLTDYYPEGTYPMNFITNHDENSWNGTEFERLGGYVKSMAALSFVMPGVPLLYSGQEVGLNRRLAFFEKDQIDWMPSGYTAFYKKLIGLKDRNVALANGSYGGSLKLLKTNSSKVVAVARTKGSNRVILVLNLSAKKATVKVTAGKLAGNYVAYSTGKKTKLKATSTVAIPAKSFVIYSTK